MSNCTKIVIVCIKIYKKFHVMHQKLQIVPITHQLDKLGWGKKLEMGEQTVPPSAQNNSCCCYKISDLLHYSKMESSIQSSKDGCWQRCKHLHSSHRAWLSKKNCFESISMYRGVGALRGVVWPGIGILCGAENFVSFFKQPAGQVGKNCTSAEKWSSQNRTGQTTCYTYDVSVKCGSWPHTFPTHHVSILFLFRSRLQRSVCMFA